MLHAARTSVHPSGAHAPDAGKARPALRDLAGEGDPDALGIDRLPVYFGTLNVHAVSEKGLPDLIRDHLGEVKHRHDDPMPPKRPQGR